MRTGRKRSLNPVSFRLLDRPGNETGRSGFPPWAAEGREGPLPPPVGRSFVNAQRLITRVPRPRVLLIMPRVVEMIGVSIRLKKVGCLVTTMTDGREAYRLWRDKKNQGGDDAFNLVLIERVMDWIGGIEFVRMVREEEQQIGVIDRPTCIIALCRAVDDPDVVLQEGFSHFLKRPFSIHIQTICRLLLPQHIRRRSRAGLMNKVPAYITMAQLFDEAEDVTAFFKMISSTASDLEEDEGCVEAMRDNIQQFERTVNQLRDMVETLHDLLQTYRRLDFGKIMAENVELKKQVAIVRGQYERRREDILRLKRLEEVKRNIAEVSKNDLVEHIETMEKVVDGLRVENKILGDKMRDVTKSIEQTVSEQIMQARGRIGSPRAAGAPTSPTSLGMSIRSAAHQAYPPAAAAKRSTPASRRVKVLRNKLRCLAERYERELMEAAERATMDAYSTMRARQQRYGEAVVTAKKNPRTVARVQLMEDELGQFAASIGKSQEGALLSGLLSPIRTIFQMQDTLYNDLLEQQYRQVLVQRPWPLFAQDYARVTDKFILQMETQELRAFGIMREAFANFVMQLSAHKAVPASFLPRGDTPEEAKSKGGGVKDEGRQNSTSLTTEAPPRRRSRNTRQDKENAAAEKADAAIQELKEQLDFAGERVAKVQQERDELQEQVDLLKSQMQKRGREVQQMFLQQQRSQAKLANLLSVQGASTQQDLVQRMDSARAEVGALCTSLQQRRSIVRRLSAVPTAAPAARSGSATGQDLGVEGKGDGGSDAGSQVSPTQSLDSDLSGASGAEIIMQVPTLRVDTADPAAADPEEDSLREHLRTALSDADPDAPGHIVEAATEPLLQAVLGVTGDVREAILTALSQPQDEAEMRERITAEVKQQLEAVPRDPTDASGGGGDNTATAESDFAGGDTWEGELRAAAQQQGSPSASSAGSEPAPDGQGSRRATGRSGGGRIGGGRSHGSSGAPHAAVPVYDPSSGEACPTCGGAPAPVAAADPTPREDPAVSDAMARGRAADAAAAAGRIEGLRAALEELHSRVMDLKDVALIGKKGFLPGQRGALLVNVSDPEGWLRRCRRAVEQLITRLQAPAALLARAELGTAVETRPVGEGGPSPFGGSIAYLVWQRMCAVLTMLMGVRGPTLAFQLVEEDRLWRERRALIDSHFELEARIRKRDARRAVLSRMRAQRRFVAPPTGFRAFAAGATVGSSGAAEDAKALPPVGVTSPFDADGLLAASPDEVAATVAVEALRRLQQAVPSSPMDFRSALVAAADRGRGLFEVGGDGGPRPVRIVSPSRQLQALSNRDESQEGTLRDGLTIASPLAEKLIRPPAAPRFGHLDPEGQSPQVRNKLLTAARLMRQLQEKHKKNMQAPRGQQIDADQIVPRVRTEKMEELTHEDSWTPAAPAPPHPAPLRPASFDPSAVVTTAAGLQAADPRGILTQTLPGQTKRNWLSPTSPVAQYRPALTSLPGVAGITMPPSIGIATRPADSGFQRAISTALDALRYGQGSPGGSPAMSHSRSAGVVLPRLPPGIGGVIAAQAEEAASPPAASGAPSRPAAARKGAGAPAPGSPSALEREVTVAQVSPTEPMEWPTECFIPPALAAAPAPAPAPAPAAVPPPKSPAPVRQDAEAPAAAAAVPAMLVPEVTLGKVSSFALLRGGSMRAPAPEAAGPSLALKGSSFARSPRHAAAPDPGSPRAAAAEAAGEAARWAAGAAVICVVWLAEKSSRLPVALKNEEGMRQPSRAGAVGWFRKRRESDPVLLPQPPAAAAQPAAAAPRRVQAQRGGWLSAAKPIYGSQAPPGQQPPPGAKPKAPPRRDPPQGSSSPHGARAVSPKASGVWFS